MSETRLAVEVRSRSRHSTKALRITLISRFSARVPPIRQRHYGHALLAWQCQNESNWAVFTLNSLALPFRTQRPIEVGLRVFGRTGHEAFGPGLRSRRGRRTNGSRRLARPGAHGGAGDRNYFDTAVQYGDGESEKNLGSVPQKLKPANVVVGTKVRLRSQDFGHIPTP